ncbi:MAG: ketopantoate reductase family protein [Eubacteriaceae bacterium]
MKIGISGLGSLGLVVGGILIDNGYDVTLIDSNLGNNKKVINSKGIKIVGYKDKYLKSNCLIPNEIDFNFDVIFSLTKQLQLKESLVDISSCINDKTVIVTCQNGIPEDEAKKILSEDQIISCSIAWGATRLDRGISKITTPPEKMDMVIGELSGDITDRLINIGKLLETIGKVQLSKNIKGVKWTKLIMNSNFMGPCGLLGCKLGDVLLNDDFVKFVPYIALEGAKVCRSLDIKPEKLQGFFPHTNVLSFSNSAERSKLIESVFKPVWIKLKEIKPSLVQDLEKGKKTEISYINGKIIEEGKKLGISTPVNSFFVNSIQDIEKGKLKPTMNNAELLKSLNID